uniref:protein SCAR1-like isoform X2 n=1 Tax=Erigeron canadensis TaxID=72917 RepID=UPI001CB91B29|nr:protein SCAR1-like isoform X2 [Erigeron canadensis]
MPLVRVEVRNEYGLGMPELYTETNREDPKALLDGVAVAGLVGLLRQLGDLAEFAAEIFHGLQEQVLITSSRSHKLVERVHNIEAALPPLEKAILAQRSHLHFAYTAGSHWHNRLRTEQNHFIYSDLPRCIMDSYEECRDPPRLHKLDKFDIGGPGACFRKYSDPTYFKRTSAGPYEAHLQSVPREKKARRNKKKRSSSRYRDVTRGAPAFLNAEKTDFGSSHFEEKASPSQDVSTFHVPQESGIERETDHLTSLDSRNGSGYIECIFRPSYSTQSEDYNVKEPSSDSNAQHNSSLDLDENIQNSYLAEHSMSKPPCITWDEKLEIIDSTGRPADTTEIPCVAEKIDPEEKEDTSSRVVERVDFDFHDEQPPPLPTPVIVGGQHDEIESETDYYMDALNTIESESETDPDCHTKRELKQENNVNNDLEGINKEDHLDDTSTNFEFHVPERVEHATSPQVTDLSSISLNTPDKFSSIEPETSPQVIETLSISLNTPDQLRSIEQETSTKVADIPSTFSNTPEESRSEDAERHVTNVCSSREPDSQPLLREQTLISHESPKTSWSTSGGQATVSNPVMFWTNGGLLGLEPSKPPDFGLPTAVGMVKTKSENSISNGGHVTREDVVFNSSKSEYSGNPSNTTTSGIDESALENDPINSSRIFEFSNRLLVNGFRKQISLVGNERLANSVKSDIPENANMQKESKTVTGIPFKEQFGIGNGTPLIAPSSPPLEHMRISFQPIDGFEPYKLKLMFPDGNDHNESSRHMFPSFQLIPEPVTSLHESASDSDDDTFCRSSPYASDDMHSNPSESNSEQWDSSDSPRIKDHELDDAFGRISSAESVSSSFVNGIRFQQEFPDHGNYDGMQPSHHGILFDIPNFDSMNGSHKQITDDFKEPTPPHPPLPPMEWRGIKPHPSATMEKEDALSEALTYALNLTPPEPTVPQQPKPAPTKQDPFVDKNDFMVNRKPNWQNLHVQNGSNHTFNGKVGEQKEDFLQQIRTKSLNLRRTSTARATTTPTGPNSVKVTAILEKASAIRQVVGSDDGEDDTWSDT